MHAAPHTGLFVIVVIFILVNIFLAIINDAFALVTEQQKVTDSNRQ